MRRISSVFSVFVLAATVAGCSDDNSGSNATGGNGGSTSTGGQTGSGGMGGSSSTTGGGSSTGGGGSFTKTGVCGRRNESVVTTTAFDGYEELHIVSEAGFGEDVCVVHYDVKRVGPAADPGGCKTAAFTSGNEDCSWTHEVQFSNAKVMLNVEGACENSELGLDAAKVAAINGTKTTYGFAAEAAGHASLVMQYKNAKWDLFVNGTWNATTGEFGFDQKNGECGYGK